MDILEIRRDDKKPAVIHTKKKTVIHVKNKPRTKIKGKNIPVSEKAGKEIREEKIAGADREHSDMALVAGKAWTGEKKGCAGGENAEESMGQESGRNSQVPQKENGNGKDSGKNSGNAEGKGKKRKNAERYRRGMAEGHKRRGGSDMLRIMGAAGMGTVLKQADGGEEIYESYLAAEISAKPIRGAVRLGKELYCRQSEQRRKERIKKKEAGSMLGKKEEKEEAADDTNGMEEQKESRDASQRKDENISQEPEGKDGQTKVKENGWKTEKSTEQKRTESIEKKTSGNKIKRVQKVGIKYKIKTAYSGMAEMKKGRESIFSGKAAAQKKGKEDIRLSVRDRMLHIFISKAGRKGKQGHGAADIKNRIAGRTVKCISLLMGGIFFLAAVLALPVIAMLTVIYNSPFAVFFPSISSGETTQEVLAAYEEEFNRCVELEMYRTAGYDRIRKVYVNFSGEGIPDNYCDIMAVYMVKHGNGDTATDMTDKAKQNLKKIFDEMCSYSVTEGTETETDENGNRITYKVKYVNVYLRTVQEMDSLYRFQEEEQKILVELMKPEYWAMLGYERADDGQEVNPEQYQAVLDAISDINGKKVVEFALSKVGSPYSQALRNSGTHFDCSSLVYYAWHHAGVSISYHGSTTAAYEGQLCYDNDWLVHEGDMQPGDLIFYSYEKNGRFMDISHVAVYAGNGMAVEAANTRLGVVYRPVQGRSSIVMVGRPR